MSASNGARTVGNAGRQGGAGASWRDKPERGSDRAIRLIGWLAHRVGRRVCRVLLVPIVLYFLATDATARRSSREFLSTALDRPVSMLDIAGHLFVFATTLLDRVYLASGDLSRFRLTIEGASLVTEALARGKGCLLLGAHLGSFDLMALANRALGREPITMLMQVDPRARLRRIAGIEDDTDSARVDRRRDGGRVIPLGRTDTLLRAYEALRDGGLVAMLADRVDSSATALPSSFLGRPALFPVGPHLLAARSESPVLMCFGLYEGGSSYRIEFVEFGPVAERFARGADLQPMVDRYCAVLSAYARRWPRNWFNFYPYWNER